MDILVRDIYSKLKANLGVENIVVAGGCVRDSVLGGKFTDVDIYIDLNNLSTPHYVNEFIKTNSLDIVEHENAWNCPYSDRVNNIFMKYDLMWKGIDIDLMVVSTKDFDSDEESFGSFVTKSFDFGLNMIYYDGFTIVESEEFSHDRDYNVLTLQTLESMDSLNHYLERANRIQKKYPNFQLDLNKVLQLKSNDKSDSGLKTEKRYGLHRLPGEWNQPLGWLDQGNQEVPPVPPPVRNQLDVVREWFEDAREFNHWQEGPYGGLFPLPDINND